MESHCESALCRETGCHCRCPDCNAQRECDRKLAAWARDMMERGQLERDEQFYAARPDVPRAALPRKK